MAKLLTAASARALPEVSVADDLTRWETVTWTKQSDYGSPTAFNFFGTDVWSHNGQIYYSSGSTQCSLNATTGVWNPCSWNVGVSFGAKIYGGNIFSFKGTTYLYFNSNLYYLSASSTSNSWKIVTTNITLSDLTSFKVAYLWTRGNNLYYTNVGSSVSEHYKITQGSSEAELVFTAQTLKKGDTSTAFTGVLRGDRIWENPYGGTIYSYAGESLGLTQAATNLWDDVNITDPSGAISGDMIWTNGTSTYACASQKSYKYIKENATWEEFSFAGESMTSPLNLWTDGTNIYYSVSATHLKLSVADINPCYLFQGGEWVKQNAFQLQDGAWVQISYK